MENWQEVQPEPLSSSLIPNYIYLNNICRDIQDTDASAKYLREQ